MSESAIRAAIVDVLEGVSGVENVHNYNRWTRTWKDFLSIMKSSDEKIHGWMVSRIKCLEKKITLRELERAHIYEITGIYGQDDENTTELTFSAVCDAVQAAFDDAEDLGGACESIRPVWGPMQGALGAQLDVFEARMFGGVLCHVAVFTLCATEAIDD